MFTVLHSSLLFTVTEDDVITSGKPLNEDVCTE